MLTAPLIYIHPGHGPTETGHHDPGAVGPFGLEEHNVVRNLAARLGHLLREHRIQTRGDDMPQFSQSAVAKANQCDAACFVALHCNSFSDPKANGVEVWHNMLTPETARIAQRVQNELVLQIRSSGKWLYHHYPVADRGIKPALPISRAGRVLSRCRMHALLVECLFISNPAEAALLSTGNMLQQLAQAIADGLALSFPPVRLSVKGE